MASYGKNSQYARGYRAAKVTPKDPASGMIPKIMPRVQVLGKHFGQTAPLGDRMTTAYSRGFEKSLADSKSGRVSQGGSKAHQIAANRKKGVTATTAKVASAQRQAKAKASAPKAIGSASKKYAGKKNVQSI